MEIGFVKGEGGKEEREMMGNIDVVLMIGEEEIEMMEKS